MAIDCATKCIKCDKPATKRCSRCSEGVDVDGNLLRTFYCGTECQLADYLDHKVQCRHANNRKQLYRGAELLKDVFYAWRLAAFDLDLSGLEYDGELLRLVEHVDDRRLRGHFSLFAFPIGLARDQQDNFALLTYMACNKAPANLKVLIENVFKGIVMLP